MDTLNERLSVLAGCIGERGPKDYSRIMDKYVRTLGEFLKLKDRIRNILNVGNLVYTISDDLGDARYKHDGAFDENFNDSLLFIDNGEGYKGIGFWLQEFEGEEDCFFTNGYAISFRLEGKEVYPPIDSKDFHSDTYYVKSRDVDGSWHTKKCGGEDPFEIYVEYLEKFVKGFPKFEKDVLADAEKILGEYKEEFGV